MTWYPNFVFKGSLLNCGALEVETDKEKARSWKSPIICPRDCHPKEPPCLALSMLISLATFSNDSPASSLLIASIACPCFSVSMCLTLIALAGFCLSELLLLCFFLAMKKCVLLCPKYLF
eukprot:NODE_9_length_64580_cov_1.431941.p50 type:complete len:120 gc:universal NODE_9_length_64580_cov_1.431941:57480-57839(+)